MGPSSRWLPLPLPPMPMLIAHGLHAPRWTTLTPAHIHGGRWWMAMYKCKGKKIVWICIIDIPVRGYLNISNYLLTAQIVSGRVCVCFTIWAWIPERNNAFGSLLGLVISNCLAGNLLKCQRNVTALRFGIFAYEIELIGGARLAKCSISHRQKVKPRVRLRIVVGPTSYDWWKQLLISTNNGS